MASTEQVLIQELNLPSCLSDRVLCRVPPPCSNAKENSPIDHGSKKSFVLYLPTVVLRKKHNPAFSLACRLANHYGVPLLILVILLDDQHLSQAPLSPIVMTSRRLAFVLEALQDSCCSDWESHGAGVAIRVHGPGSRNPHHLSLCHASLAVVSDEPFVDPYREYVRRITKTCKAASVPFWTVDGSTSVPPNSKLTRKPSATKNNNNYSSVFHGDVSFAGAPSKAWRWEKQTDSVRKHHVYGAYREKALDAPELKHKLPNDFFLNENENDNDDCTIGKGDGNSCRNNLLAVIPSKWKDPEANAPGQRPWTVSELREISDCKAWAMTWKGADSSVPPCKQTHGSVQCARSRWKSFVNLDGLKNYAKRRNFITNPHAVSRISCYLNMGILSIFDVLHDVWEAKSKKGYSTGCQKYLEEVGKWREGSYVHAFANPNYHTTAILPPWAIRHLESLRKPNVVGNGYDYKELEGAATRDETWNAMQGYLIETGELHNNARMTWGKTAVHWQAMRVTTQESLWQLCCLNDRFALDGLSPPSYGGVLWCYGWQDKPSKGNQVSEKWAHRYRTGASGFLQAKESLLEGECSSSSTAGLLFRNGAVTGKRKGQGDDGRSAWNTPSPAAKKAKKDSKSILSYFGPASTGAQQIG